MTNEVQALERAVERTGIDVPLVLVNDQAHDEIDPELKAAAVNDPIGLDTIRLLFRVLETHGAWTLVLAERKIFEGIGPEISSMDRVNIEDVPCLSEADVRYVTPIVDGDWSELPPDAVALARERCDLAVRFGFGLLKGDILQAPSFGVLSFHSADIRTYRGLGVPQAWADCRDTMGVTLQRLNEEIDGGEIISYGETDVTGCATLWEAFEEVNEVKRELLAEGIERLREPSWEPTVAESLGPYYSLEKLRTPTFAGRVLLKNLSGRLGRVFR